VHFLNLFLLPILKTEYDDGFFQIPLLSSSYQNLSFQVLRVQFYSKFNKPFCSYPWLRLEISIGFQIRTNNFQLFSCASKIVPVNHKFFAKGVSNSFKG